MSKYEENILDQIKAISNELIACSIVHKPTDGLYWPFSPSLTNHECIYHGSSGIILYFIDVFQLTGVKKYLDTAIGAANWTIDLCKVSTVNNNFYTGRLGAVYSLLQLSKVTNDLRFGNAAKKIVDDIQLDLTNRSCDLISGVSGDLLGWILISSDLFTEKVELAINKCVEFLIKRLRIDLNRGVYWEVESLQNELMVGFAHGPSGVSYVLGLLCFKDKENCAFLKEISDAGLRFEDMLYSKSKGTWASVHAGIFSLTDLDNYKLEYKNGTRDFVKASYNDMSWCNGAPGLIYSRVYSQNITSKRYSEMSVETICDSVLNNSQSADLTLCHGLSGLGVFLLDTPFESEKSKKTNAYIFDKIKSKSEEYGLRFCGGREIGEKFDYSLFLGFAGIGYYLLGLTGLNKKRMNLLKPMPNHFENIKSITFNNLNKLILLKFFPKTIAVLPIKHRELLYRMIFSLPFKLEGVFIRRLSEFLNTPKKKAAFAFDWIKLEFSSIGITKPFSLVRKLESIENASHSNVYAYLNTTYRLSERLILRAEDWDWTSKILKKRKTYFVIYKDLNEVIDYKLLPLSYQLCCDFTNPNTGSNILNKSPRQVTIPEKSMVDVIKFFLKKGILVKCNEAN